jgi:hypothetical protein
LARGLHNLAIFLPQRALLEKMATGGSQERFYALNYPNRYSIVCIKREMLKAITTSGEVSGSRLLSLFPSRTRHRARRVRSFDTVKSGSPPGVIRYELFRTFILVPPQPCILILSYGHRL